MEITTDTVVISLAGNDRGGIFAVTDVTDARHARIADGRSRKMEKAKKKNVKHLLAIGRLGPPEAGVRSNRSLRMALRAFRGAGDRELPGEVIDFVQR